MLSVAEIKKFLGDEEISDEEARKIKDACYGFAKLALEKLQEERKSKMTKS